MTKEEQDKIYKELRKEYTDEEIADSMIFSGDLTEEESIQLRDAIRERSKNRTEEEKEQIRKFVEKIRNEK